MNLISCVFQFNNDDNDYEEDICFPDEFPNVGDNFVFSYHGNERLIDKEFKIINRTWDYDSDEINLIIYLQEV